MNFICSQSKFEFEISWIKIFIGNTVSLFLRTMEYSWYKPNLNCNYHFPIDLALIGIPIDTDRFIRDFSMCYAYRSIHTWLRSYYKYIILIMISPNSRARKRGKKMGEVNWEHGRIWGEQEGNASERGMVQPRQQHV